MVKMAFVSACLAYLGHARQIDNSAAQWQGSQDAEHQSAVKDAAASDSVDANPSKSLAILFQAFNPTATSKAGSLFGHHPTSQSPVRGQPLMAFVKRELKRKQALQRIKSARNMQQLLAPDIEDYVRKAGSRARPKFRAMIRKKAEKWKKKVPIHWGSKYSQAYYDKQKLQKDIVVNEEPMDMDGERVESNADDQTGQEEENDDEEKASNDVQSAKEIPADVLVEEEPIDMDNTMVESHADDQTGQEEENDDEEKASNNVQSAKEIPADVLVEEEPIDMDNTMVESHADDQKDQEEEDNDEEKQ